MKAHHAVAELPLRHVAASGYDSAGHFVAQNLGRWDVGVVNLLDVGAANAAGGDFDQDFAVGHFRDGDFLDADDSLFAVDTGAHGLGDGAQRFYGLERCTGPAHRASFEATAIDFPASAAIYVSKKSARRLAASPLRLPSRIKPGIAEGLRTICPARRAILNSPSSVPAWLKS